MIGTYNYTIHGNFCIEGYRCIISFLIKEILQVFCICFYRKATGYYIIVFQIRTRYNRNLLFTYTSLCTFHYLRSFYRCTYHRSSFFNHSCFLRCFSQFLLLCIFIRFFISTFT